MSERSNPMNTIKWIIVITVTAIHLPASSLNAEYLYDDVETLQGLSGLYLYVHSLPPRADELGLTQEQILADVDTQLRSAGIPVASYSACCDLPGSPYLFVGIGLVDGPQEDVYAVTAHLELRQVCSLEKSPEQSYHATTWMRGETILVEERSLASDLQELLHGWVRMFIYDYRFANRNKEGA